MKRVSFVLSILLILFCMPAKAEATNAQNPVIFADVPDLSMIRVGDTYYMSSTTMHMIPGVPIMKSTDLINWTLISYANPFLSDSDDMNLENGQNAYGRGTWASSMRYHKGIFYVSTFSNNTGKSYLFRTKDPENEAWETIILPRSLHDHSLFFDDDGKIYMVWGGGRIRIIELNSDFTDFVPGSERVLIENASEPGGRGGLPAEGSQLFKINGQYYLINISWPAGGMRTVLVHRAKSLQGPWEGRVGLRDLGVAQGGLIDTPEGRWFAYLFRDFGAVGRIPYTVPVEWKDGWPVFGVEGKVPMTLDLPASKGLIPGVVASDEFKRKKGEPALPLVWQWNHNPNNDYWSVTDRKGYLRLKTFRLDKTFLDARNSLTQRAFGPVSTASICMDVRKMNVGDVAGLGLLQKQYGQLAVKCESDGNYLVMINGRSGEPTEVERIALTKRKVYLRASCDFTERKDVARFAYSLDGKKWTVIGNELKMSYTMPHFMGYRFALFNYATQETGGYVDFDYFRISDEYLVSKN